VDLSFVAGFRWVMLVSAGLALLSAISAGMFIHGNNPAHAVTGVA
jgi:hypothetical protein